jgi:hypothetical protein
LIAVLMHHNNASEIIRQADRLFGQRQELIGFWDELALMFWPEMSNFQSDSNIGHDYAAHLSDASPVLARRDLGESLGSMLRPSGQPWLKCAIEGDRQPDPGSMEALYLEFMTERTRERFYHKTSGFVRAMKASDNFYATFGNSVISVSEGMSPKDILFKTWHLRDVVWRDNIIGNPTTVFRKAKMTAQQMAQTFGEKVLPESAKRALINNPDQEFELLHACMPSSDYARMGKVEGKRWDYVSVWCIREGNAILRQRYVPECIYVIPRWQIVTGSQYALSPAAVCALPFSRMIQRMATTVINAAEKSVDPPLIAKGEVVKNGINLDAGSIIWVDGDYDERTGEALRPLDLGKNVNLGREMIGDLRNQIERAFYLNKLALPQAQAKTAYETARLVEQYVRDALPLFETMESDYLDPVCDLGVTFLIRTGAYGPADEIPQGLKGKEIGFQFENPLRHALRQSTVKAFTDTASLLQVAAAADQTAPDNIDLVKALRDAVGASGDTQSWIRPKEQVEALQQQRAEQAKAMAEQALAMQQGQQPGQPRPEPDVQPDVQEDPIDAAMAGDDAMGMVAA